MSANQHAVWHRHDNPGITELVAAEFQMAPGQAHSCGTADLGQNTRNNTTPTITGKTH
jgi:hypothetical protein